MSSKSPEKLKNWLDKLQQESWQLELILSGFAIFLILGLKEPIDESLRQALRVAFTSTKFGLIIFWFLASKLVWFFVVINLVIHLFLRSLWISTIGLRYVSEDIDLEELNLAPIFKRFLGKNVKNFDQYIENLEKICSTIFAFTFLIIFVILSSALYFLISEALNTFVLDQLKSLLGQAGVFISQVIRAILTIGLILYLIDFITLGWLKSLNRFSKIYYPFYRLFGWLTLAVLYRPLYYNLIDNRFGRWVGLLIVPYIIIALVGNSVHLQYGIYFPKEKTKHQLYQSHYDDLTDFKELLNQNSLTAPSIPSKYIDNDYLELFIPYNGTLDNPTIKEICPNIVPAKKEKIILRGVINVDLSDSLDYNIDTIINCFNEIYRFSINDSIYQDKELMIYEHPLRKTPGFLTIVDISHLPRGQHQIKFERYGRNIYDRKNPANLSWLDPEYIPFWKTSEQ